MAFVKQLLFLHSGPRLQHAEILLRIKRFHAILLRQIQYFVLLPLPHPFQRRKIPHVHFCGGNGVKTHIKAHCSASSIIQEHRHPLRQRKARRLI